MSLVVTYESGLSSEFTDISDRFREYTFDLAQDAEEGSVATSSVTIDDPDGDYDIKGWRRFRFYENAAAGSNTLIANVWITDRTIVRGPYKTGAGRQWVCQVADMNSVLAFRVFTQSDANRPAETDVQRLQWMQGELGTPGVPETEYVDTTGPVNMDAVDYRGQTRLSVIDDCAQASGKNYFVYTKESGAGLALGLWYAHTDSTMYSSPLRLTNVNADITGDALGMTYAIAEDSELKRDPSRVYSGAYLQFDGGQVFEEDLSISNEFTRRDAIVPSENVKTQAKATARALRYLDDFSTEADRISTAVILPAAKVNFVREGMRIQYKATHHPGYETFQYLRVLQRKVKFNSEDPDMAYLVSLDLASEGPQAVPVESCSADYPFTASRSFSILGTQGVPGTSTDGYVYYGRGGTPVFAPTPNSPSLWGFPIYNTESSDFAGDCTNSALTFFLVGGGTLALSSRHHSSVGPRAMLATVVHKIGSTITTDATYEFDSGDDVNIVVPDDAGCTHIVQVTDGEAACGTSWGWDGAVWTSNH